MNTESQRITKWHPVLTPNAPPKRQPRLPATAWEPFRRKVLRHREQGKTYEDIRKILSEEDTFHPTYSQLKNYIQNLEPATRKRKTMHICEVDSEECGGLGSGETSGSSNRSDQSSEISRQQPTPLDINPTQRQSKKIGYLDIYNVPANIASPESRENEMSLWYEDVDSSALVSGAREIGWHEYQNPTRGDSSPTRTLRIDISRTSSNHNEGPPSPFLPPDAPGDTFPYPRMLVATQFPYLPPIHLREEPISNTRLGSIHLAALQGSLELVKVYTESGQIDVNATTEQGRTALHIAIENGFTDVVRYLLGREDVDQTVRDKDGWMPLHVAARKGSLEMFRALLKAGADICATTSSGKTALHIAVAYDQSFLAACLIKDKNWSSIIPTKDNCGWTALHEAARRLNRNIVKSLLIRGATPKDPARCPDSPIPDEDVPLAPLQLWVKSLATVSGNVLPDIEAEFEAIIAVLVAKGAQVEDKFSQGRTVLHLMARSESWSSLQAILKLGPFGSVIDEVDYRGSTALHYAVYQDMASCAAVLLDNGASTSIMNTMGYNPLHASTLRGNTDMMAVLLSHGADPNARDGRGQTALHMATINNNLEAITLLLQHGVDANLVTLTDDFPITESIGAKVSEISSIPDIDASWADFPFQRRGGGGSGNTTATDADKVHTSNTTYPPKSPSPTPPVPDQSSRSTSSTVPTTETTKPPNAAFRCRKENCGRGFTDRQNRNRHERVVHCETNQKIFKCTVAGCNMQSTRKDNLLKHVRSKHPGVLTGKP